MQMFEPLNYCTGSLTTLARIAAILPWSGWTLHRRPNGQACRGFPVRGL